MRRVYQATRDSFAESLLNGVFAAVEDGEASLSRGPPRIRSTCRASQKLPLSLSTRLVDYERGYWQDARSGDRRPQWRLLAKSGPVLSIEGA